MKIKTGKIYLVKHQRKGVFKMVVNKVDDVFIHGNVIEGSADAVLQSNTKEVGDSVTCRKSLCTLEKIN